MGHHACLREKEHLFRYRAYFEGNLLRFARARADVQALITQISCAVGTNQYGGITCWPSFSRVYPPWACKQANSIQIRYVWTGKFIDMKRKNGKSKNIWRRVTQRGLRIIIYLMWLTTISSTIREVDFDGWLLPLFINWCYNHGIKKLPNHRWTR